MSASKLDLPASMKAWALAVTIVTITGCGEQPAALVDTAAAPAAQAASDPAAVEVLERMTAAYREAAGYFDNAEYHESFMKQGEDVLIEPPPHQVSVVFERPNRFRILRRVPQSGASELIVTVASDGERLTATASDLPGQVLSKPAPTELKDTTIAPDPALYRAMWPVPFENIHPQLDLLIATGDRTPRLLAESTAKLLEDRELEGVACRRIALQRPAGKYVLWIDAVTHVLRRLEAPTEEVRKQLDPKGVMLDWRLWIDFHDATLGGAMADKVFQIDPPADAKTVESFDSSE